jgi:uncharacterized protein YraI
MKRASFCFLVLLVLVLWALPGVVSGQGEVTAEAIGQANLRANTDVNSTLLGQISAGTRYPVIGRSEYYPWVLLADPTSGQPLGWVFNDLMTIYGALNAVPFSALVLDGVPVAPTAPPVLQPSPTPVSSDPQAVGAALPTPTLPPTPLPGVVALIKGEINIRFGPGADYPRIGVAQEGEQYPITGRHTQFPWIQIRYPSAPNGVGWIAVELVDVQGDLNSVPPISQTRFDLPTLTPTPQAVVASSLMSATSVPISPAFQALGDELWTMMLTAGFEPETSRLAALFLMNLKTGEAITSDSQIAFSGMSLNKIAILSALYSTLTAPPDLETAIDIANMMVCSENSASNALLARLGGGDPYQGGQAVTAFMSRIGLGNTFIVAPFLTDPNATPMPVVAPTTQADQVRAAPDYSNQMTVDELGWLLAGVYQCAFNNGGPLMSAAPNEFDQRECRQMLDVMSSNNMGQPLLMSAGVPASIRVAHKHGWTADTHGNAGIVFTPGGDYVLVMALHNPTWLDFNESFPLISEMSRTVYNTFNPDQPLAEDRAPNIVEVKDCLVSGTPIIDELTSLNFSS